MRTLLPVLAVSLVQFGVAGAFGITIGLGKAITLNCGIGGTVSEVVWYRGKRHNSEALLLTYNCFVVAKEYTSRLKNIRCDTNNFDFQLSNVRISDRGDYKCVADGVEAITNIAVLVPPLTPTVTNPSPVKVGDTATFTCNAENEHVTKPVIYTWTTNGNTVPPGTTDHGSLVVTPVAKGHAGKYICVAKNFAGSKTSTEHEFVVFYAPDYLQLYTTTSSSSKLENETETFTCKAIGGKPVPSVKLIRHVGTTKETLIQENNRVVTLARQMMRQDNSAKFYCQATGQGIRNYMQSKIITSNVLFPPDVQVKINKTTVHENEFVRFECDTSGGNPELIARYQWLWKKSGSTVPRLIQDTENGTRDGMFLEITRIPHDRSGVYSCKVWNQGGMGQASTYINVQYSPRRDPEANMKYDVDREIGKDVSLELFIIANPTPVTSDYAWYKDGSILSNSSRQYEILSGPTFSKLKIKNVKSSDYANYSCSVKTSGFQEKVFEFRLHKNGPPSAPSELEVVHVSAVAATLEWISEYNGGSEQRFYVQYKKSTENWDVASEVPQGGVTDPDLKMVARHKVIDLESNASYMFRVRSTNFHPGPPYTSNFSNIAVAKIPEKPETSLIAVSRTDNLVTVRWKQVTGKYTAIKIKYCPIDKGDCMNYYTVPNLVDNFATFLVNANTTYHYYMVVEDGDDVVYMSIKDEVHKKTSIVLVAVVGGLVGGAILVAITCLILAVVLWKRGLVRWGNRQSHRPANDTVHVDNDDTFVESATNGNDPLQIYVNIGSVTDSLHHIRTTDQNHVRPRVTRHHIPAHGVPNNESPSSSDDDVYAYDYADRPSTGHRDPSEPVPAQQANQGDSEKATRYEKLLRIQGPESPLDTYTDLIPTEEESGQSTPECGLRQADGAQELTASHSCDDSDYSQWSHTSRASSNSSPRRVFGVQTLRNK